MTGNSELPGVYDVADERPAVGDGGVFAGTAVDEVLELGSG